MYFTLSYEYKRYVTTIVNYLNKSTLFLCILGLHFLQSPDSLKTFVSVQQEHFKFGTCDSQQNFLTADNIELHINATIFYRLVDVVTLFTARIKDEKELYETLHSQGKSCTTCTSTYIIA